MRSVTFTVKGQSRTATSEDIVAKMQGVAPEPLRAIVVKVGDVRYPVKQVFSTAFGLDRADFISHQARSILLRLGFEVSRVQDVEENQMPKNLFGVQAMTWIGVEAQTPTQALSLARQYALALSERRWDIVDRLIEHGVVVSTSAVVSTTEDWNTLPTPEQVEAGWEETRRVAAEGSISTPQSAERVAHITSWQKVHDMAEGT